MTAFSNVLKESRIQNDHCTIIADKGFASDDDFDLMVNKNLNYIVPIRRGNRFTQTVLPFTTNSFDTIFSFNNRAIESLKIEQPGFNVFVYYDAQLYANELADFIQRGEKDNNTTQQKADLEMKRRRKNKGRLSDEELKKLVPKNLLELKMQKPEMGTVTIRTNRLELNSQQVYQIYKQRQAIEQFFKTYEETLDFETSYMRDRVTEEAWLFLNHLSAMIGMDCLNSISAAGCSNNVSFEDVRQVLRKITASKIDGKWQVAPIKSKVNALLGKLHATIKDEELASMLEACSSL